MIKEMSGHQLQIGDKMRMNIAELEKGDLDGVEFTTTGKDYWRYMNEHPNEVYTVVGIDLETAGECIYMLDGFMSDNTWAADELIHIPEPDSVYEVIKNMMLDEMVNDLIPLIEEVCEDGVPSPGFMREWLTSKPTKD